MTFKISNNQRALWQWDTSAPYWTNFFHEIMMSIKETPCRFFSQCGKASHLGKRLLLLWLLTVCCAYWTCRPHRTKTFKDKTVQSFEIFFSFYRRVELQSYCQTLPKHGRTVLQFSCFKDKSANYSRLVGSKWMSQCCGDILEELYR